jgi:hypothetical protein
VAVDAGGPPPEANAKVEVPHPSKLFLPVVKSVVLLQLVPFHSSVCCLGFALPPKTNPEVYSHAPPNDSLVVLKLFTSVQLLPFHTSVKLPSGSPPQPIAAV